MSDLQIFNFNNKQIRALTIEGEPYFVGKDVVDILGYRNGSRDINRHVDEDDRMGYRIGTPSRGEQTMTVINESGLYSLILSSKLPKAKEFKHWVTSEVLPTIRKHGAYMTDQKAAAIVTDKNALADLLQQAAYQLKEKDVKIERLTAELEVSSKKATYLDLIVETKDGMTATQVAQDYGLSAKKFNALLHALGVQRKVNEQWILYAKYQGKGYIASKTFTYTDSTGKNHAKINTVWTQKGRLFLYELLKANGILPLIEREDIA